MEKIIRLGLGSNGHVFCRIKYDDKGRLSISGVEGPRAGGSCRGSCGQIVRSLKHDAHTIKPAPGWNAGLISRFFDTWDRWHLNYMREGTPEQETYLREHPIIDRHNYYTSACSVLNAAGLNPDGGHKYGHAWLHEDVPRDVLDFLFSLPDTDKTPAWV